MDIVFFSEEYNQALVDFVQKVWNKDATVESLMKEHKEQIERNPYGEQGGRPVVLAVDQGKVIGHLAATPCKLWANGQEQIMYWLSGLHILPEGRGMGVAKLLPRAMMERLAVVTGFFVLEAPLKIYTRLGWTIPGKIPDYLKIINARRLAQSALNHEVDLTNGQHNTRLLKIMKHACSCGNFIIPEVCAKTYNNIMNLIPQKKDIRNVKQVEIFDERVDKLWHRAKQHIACAQIRSKDYLNWYYDSKFGWIKLIYEENGDVLGYAVIAVKGCSEKERLKNVKILTLVDMLWDFNRDDIFNSMLEYAEVLARSCNVDTLICSINRKEGRKNLLKNAFLKIPSTVYFGYYSSNSTINLSKNIEDWYITRGDADAAGNLAPNG